MMNEKLRYSPILAAFISTVCLMVSLPAHWQTLEVPKEYENSGWKDGYATLWGVRLFGPSSVMEYESYSDLDEENRLNDKVYAKIKNVQGLMISALVFTIVGLTILIAVKFARRSIPRPQMTIRWVPVGVFGFCAILSLSAFAVYDDKVAGKKPKYSLGFVQS